MGPSWAVLGPSWAVLGRLGTVLRRLGSFLVPSWGCLGASCGRLGAILGRRGALLGVSWGVLGPLGGQHPKRARGLRFLEASWGRLGLIFKRFLDCFRDKNSILFLPYHEIPQHGVKPKNIIFVIPESLSRPYM